MATAERAPAGSVQRLWWSRAASVLLAPKAAFAPLRETSEESLEARQEPILAVILLAGIAGVLASNASGTLLDRNEVDLILVAVWAFVAGGIYGVATYFLAGAALYLGIRGFGSSAPYRQARHVVAFAAVPIAASLLALWPVRLALFGDDVFRTGGSDAGRGGDLFDWLELAFVAWSLALLPVGVRAVHGWAWGRSLAAVALALLVVAAFGALPSVL